MTDTVRKEVEGLRLEASLKACCDTPDREYSGGDRPWEGD